MFDLIFKCIKPNKPERKSHIDAGNGTGVTSKVTLSNTTSILLNDWSLISKSLPASGSFDCDVYVIDAALNERSKGSKVELSSANNELPAHNWIRYPFQGSGLKALLPMFTWSVYWVFPCILMLCYF